MTCRKGDMSELVRISQGTVHVGTITRYGHFAESKAAAWSDGNASHTRAIESEGAHTTPVPATVQPPALVMQTSFTQGALISIVLGAPTCTAVLITGVSFANAVPKTGCKSDLF